jgi:hypothetical protein
MVYTGQQRFLLQAAANYSGLGYRVGFCKGKSYLGEYQTSAGNPWVQDVSYPTNFDGISIIPDGIVCVDIDVPDFGVVWDGALPPTWKERSPRGWHLFYRIHNDMRYSASPKIGWREHVDLLVKDRRKKKTRPSRYEVEGDSEAVWGEHVLTSPTQGYSRIYPDHIPAIMDLPEAPIWLLDALEK